MKATRFFALVSLGLLFCGALAQAATVTGTVTDKTTNKPAAGDPVVLLDVQAQMGEAAHATTDAKGHYTLDVSGPGPYLIRVTHQGAGYFIAAPQGGGPGDIPVYDVSAKVQGVNVEADVMEMETSNGQLSVDERYFVHNTSSPPVTQWSHRSFEIVLPPGAVVAESGAQRPNGLPTSVKLNPDGPKGHYSFDFPIQPDDGEKDTLFQVSYSLPYSSGTVTFKPQETLAANNVAVLLPMSMSLVNGAGAAFNPVIADPGMQTFLARNVIPGKTIEFTVSGTGSIPREDQGAGGGPGDNGAAGLGNQPGGGIGQPINQPGPLSKYKWWILGALGLLLAAAAAFLLRKPASEVATAPVRADAPLASRVSTGPAALATPASHHAALLSALKEELFALESEKVSGTLAPEEYAEQKAALETVLKRALKTG